MSAIPDAAWVVIGGAIGALLQFFQARMTNAATISQQKRQSDTEQLDRLLASKDADIKAERELRLAEQARADKYLTMLMEDRQFMHDKAAELKQQQTEGVP